jgi:ABC-type transporter Mla subunit MlaD
MALTFRPSRTYVPSVPSPMSALRDRLPEVLERTEQTLRTLRDIVAKIPDSLERSDRFFTNVEQIMRESDLPQLSASARTFFTTTSGQIGAATTDLEKALGASGSLATLAEEARAALKDADLPGSKEAARDALDRTGAAADELRRSLPAIRETLAQLRDLARRLDEQPESVVYGPRRPKGKQQ